MLRDIQCGLLGIPAFTARTTPLQRMGIKPTFTAFVGRFSQTKPVHNLLYRSEFSRKLATGLIHQQTRRLQQQFRASTLLKQTTQRLSRRLNPFLTMKVLNVSQAQGSTLRSRNLLLQGVVFGIVLCTAKERKPTKNPVIVQFAEWIWLRK